LEVNPPGPAQLYEQPGVVEFPDRLALLFVQVSTPAAVATATGATEFVPIVTSAVLVQPFTGSVTVTVYVPATDVLSFWLEDVNPEGPAQFQVTPVVSDVALISAKASVHVMVPPVPGLTSGVVVFVVAVTLAVLVHPFEREVTTSV
jgi:hypothetical protein